MPGLSFKPYCGACGGLDSRGVCKYTACINSMACTVTPPITAATPFPNIVKEKKPYVQPLMEIFDIPDDVEEILIRTKEKTMRYVSDGDGWIFQEVSV